MSLRGVEILITKKACLVTYIQMLLQHLTPLCNNCHPPATEMKSDIILKFVIYLVAFNEKKVRILFIVQKIRVNDFAEISRIVSAYCV